MKKYRVGFYYEENGYTEVEAKSKEHAEAKVREMLSEDGTEDMEVDMVARDFGITDSKEME